MADVTLQARINGGSVRTGGIRTGVVVGDTCQLTALSKAGWEGSRVTWEIFDYPPDFACPSGWSEDSDGVYYVTGSADPPEFELTDWGKYLTRVTAANQSPDERTCIDIASPSGLRDIMRREGAQFGGNRALWVKDQKLNWRTMEAFLQGAGTWTPAQIPGAYFWAKGITDATLRTMTGSRIDLMANGIPGGVSITRSAGTPIIDTTKVRNGYNPMVMDSTTNLGAASGGPVGNAAHCIIILTDGSDATAFTGFVRAGAVGGSGGLGLTTSGRYAAGLVAGEGVPQVASPEPLADGALRMLHCQHRPNYGYLMVGIDGRAPIAASGSAFAHLKTLALDGSFAFSNIEAGRTPNTSPIWDAVLVSQEVSAGDLARLAAYWQAKFALPKLAPMIHTFGDSLTDPGPISPATTNWPAVMLTALNAQLTIDGRTNCDLLNTALSGKMLNGLVWAAGSPNICRQADGLYPTIVLTSPQGIHYSAPYSRSGRRKYDISITVAGTNDICNASRTGAQIIEDLKYVQTQKKAHGYQRIMGTIPPGSQAAGYFIGARETYRQEVNDWIVNDAYNEGFAEEPGVDFEAAGLAWNTTYYGAGPDALHQNDTGKALMAAAMLETVYRLIRRIDP